MNTKFLIFATVALFAIGDAMCQHAVVQANYPNDVERSIVREYVYPAMVSYVETAVEHYFAYADASMAVTNCEISHDISVTDMELHGQFAYFCGYNTVSGVGVWGWFDVNTLISGALSYYIYDNFDCSGLYADSLFSIAVYEEQGLLHIATVGSTTDGASEKRACLIDITGTEGSVAGWSYQMGVSICYGDSFNRLTRVCVTDNYIVAAGEADPGFCSEGYRIHLRGNPFMAGGPQDTLYTFTRGGDSHDHNGKDMALTHTVGDTFASAVYWYTTQPSPTPDGILVNVYDIAQVLTGPGTTPVYSKYCNLPQLFPTYTYKYSIFDLIYNKSNNGIVLLLNGEFPYGIGKGSLISELPLPLPAGGSSTYLQDIYLTSLDNYKNKQNFVAQGYDGADPKQSTSFTQPLSTLPICATTVNYSTIPSNYSEKTHPCSYKVCADSFKCSIVTQAASSTIPIKTICIEP